MLDGTTPQRGDLCFWTWGGDARGVKGPLILGASYLIRGDYRLHCAPDGRQILQQIGSDNLMKDVKNAALEKELGEKLRQWRESVQADNTQALAEVEKGGRMRDR